MLHRFWTISTITMMIFSSNLFASAENSTTQENLNFVWIITAAALVFLMQAGFSALESGLVRAKNSINVALKNFSDLIFSMVAFFAVGFAFMFGVSESGIMGATGFFLDGKDQPYDYAYFIFQAVFAGTAATIVSGAVAERMRFEAYLVATVVISAFIYPNLRTLGLE